MNAAEIRKLVTTELMITVPEAARRLAVSRSTLYNLMNDGRLLSVKIGGSRRIWADAVHTLLSDLLREQQPELVALVEAEDDDDEAQE